MATLVLTCPHCETEKASFRKVAQSYKPVSPMGSNRVRNFVYAQCAACLLPVSVELANMYGSQLNDLDHYPSTLEQTGFDVVEIWPNLPRPSAPQHLSAPVERAFLAAERTFGKEGLEETSAGSYGRALDLGTKEIAGEHAELTLFRRINKLAEIGRVTQDIADWSHQIRLVRNDALHAPDQVSQEELAAIRAFTDTILTYLFTLPGMLAERRAATAEGRDPGS